MPCSFLYYRAMQSSPVTTRLAEGETRIARWADVQALTLMYHVCSDFNLHFYLPYH